MKIKQVTLNGFGIFREKQTIEFIPGLNSIVGINHDATEADSNGSGKTTILNAITWCLFGTTATGLRKDTVVNHHPSCNRAEVELVFDNGFSIRRVKKLNSSEKLYLNSMDTTGMDLRHIQSIIESRLNLNYQLFTNALYICRESKSVQFIRATPAERLKIVEFLFSGEQFKKAQELVNKEFREVGARIEANNSRIAWLQSQIENMQKQVQAQRQQVASTEKEIQQKYQKQLGECSDSILEIKSKIDSESELLEQYEKQLQTYQDNKHRVEIDRQVLENSPPTHTDIDDVCPACGTNIGDAANRSDYMLKVQAKQMQLGQYASILDSLHTSISKYASATNVARDSLNNNRSLLSVYQSKHKSLHDQLELEKNSTRRVSDLITTFEANIRQYVSDKEALELENATLVEDSRYYNFWKEGFGTGGIRSVLLDTVREQLKHYCNYWTEIISGGMIQIDFPVNSKEGFDIQVYAYGVKYSDISMYSTGEGWRANFILLLSLASALRALQTTPLNILILDDILEGSLDQTGIDRFIDVINRVLPQHFENILLTTPRSTEFSGNVIIVERKNNSARILEDVNGIRTGAI